jgi:hypothetical protein
MREERYGIGNLFGFSAVYRMASADRAVLAGLARLLPRRRRGRFFVQPASRTDVVRSA